MYDEKAINSCINAPGECRIIFPSGQKRNIGAGYEKSLFIKPFPISVSVGAHSAHLK
jgi:hypothetical protein